MARPRQRVDQRLDVGGLIGHGGHRGGRPPLGVVQRLDVETSGLLVFARSREAYASLKGQLARHRVERTYLAIVAGRAQPRTYRSHLAEGGDGRRGSTRDRKRGKRAVTHVEVVERLAEATLVSCRLETGRTHQIRIHLSEAGHPVLGDRRYARRRIAMPPRGERVSRTGRTPARVVDQFNP